MNSGKTKGNTVLLLQAFKKSGIRRKYFTQISNSNNSCWEIWHAIQLGLSHISVSHPLMSFNWRTAPDLLALLPMLLSSEDVQNEKEHLLVGMSHTDEKPILPVALAYICTARNESKPCSHSNYHSFLGFKHLVSLPKSNVNKPELHH